MLMQKYSWGDAGSRTPHFGSRPKLQPLLRHHKRVCNTKQTFRKLIRKDTYNILAELLTGYDPAFDPYRGTVLPIKLQQQISLPGKNRTYGYQLRRLMLESINREICGK